MTVVAGIGINIDLPGELSLDDESGWVQRPVDLRSISAGVPAREQLAATTVNALFETFARFAEQGFSAFANDWRSLDWLLGREVIADMPDGKVVGVAAGVDADGALIVDVPTGSMRVVSGTIALPEVKGASQ